VTVVTVTCIRVLTLNRSCIHVLCCEVGCVYVVKPSKKCNAHGLEFDGMV
jgi:hypothetical protein